ncbi:MAG: SsrA-binding protein SmpB [Tenuifilaceae bacterium]|jgi:SsrA-binding protein|nr:SsrA-binding protein SmpB [Bacteroidales bacterium]MDI9516610.1 SsrA-binding protein SmpB [Bacteroidota bacterium]NLH55788.1 SsrA-binding protein SmpB [Rikenellaceae bacterium]OQC61772.1 MAG: SsrA-binding protein [Bacteroidetes bacterium ADurb.Bin008]HNV80482.1 SsrA-binding protein SmpB [Tenuifilaceae bacterium]
MSSENRVVIKNKRASFLFEILETFTAGIVLTGTEIKSIRMGKASLVDAYCKFIGNELWLTGMHVAEYSYGTYNNHEPKRERKLLLNRTELRKLSRSTKEKGLTIVALKLFIDEKGLAKVDIGLARGKKVHDKREDQKKKESKREMDRLQKY